MLLSLKGYDRRMEVRSIVIEPGDLAPSVNIGSPPSFYGGVCSARCAFSVMYDWRGLVTQRTTKTGFEKAFMGEETGRLLALGRNHVAYDLGQLKLSRRLIYTAVFFILLTVTELLFGGLLKKNQKCFDLKL